MSVSPPLFLHVSGQSEVLVFLSCEESGQKCPLKCVGSFISTDRGPLPELIAVTVTPGNIKFITTDKAKPSRVIN